MPSFSNLALQEPSTVSARVATVTVTRGTTNERQEILVLGDPESSIGLAQVLAAAPASTTYGLVVRQFDSTIANLSTGSVRVVQSSAAELLATVTPAAGSTWAVRPLQSSAADLQVTATPVAGSTWNVRPLQSSAADLQATVTPAAGSTWVIGHGKVSTTASSSNTGSSGAVTIVSSGANTHKVYAYSLTHNSTASVLFTFLSSAAGTELWRVRLTGSSAGGVGANLALAPPGYLFRSTAAVLLNVSEAISADYSVAFFSEST